jgi:hypothetical protein
MNSLWHEKLVDMATLLGTKKVAEATDYSEVTVKAILRGYGYSNITAFADKFSCAYAADDPLISREIDEMLKSQPPRGRPRAPYMRMEWFKKFAQAYDTLGVEVLSERIGVVPTLIEDVRKAQGTCAPGGDNLAVSARVLEFEDTFEKKFHENKMPLIGAGLLIDHALKALKRCKKHVWHGRGDNYGDSAVDILAKDFNEHASGLRGERPKSRDADLFFEAIGAKIVSGTGARKTYRFLKYKSREQFNHPGDGAINEITALIDRSE